MTIIKVPESRTAIELYDRITKHVYVLPLHCQLITLRVMIINHMN